MRLIALISVVFLMACSNQKQKTESISPEMSELVTVLGSEIVSKAQQTLGSNLMQQINKNGVDSALGFCNLAAYPILDTLNVGMNVKIKRAAIKARNENDLPTDYEKRIIIGYEEALSKNIPLEPVVQLLNEEEVLYAVPIKTKNEMCLKCHGNQGDVEKSTIEKIENLYPSDKATGHSVGDLRGIWSIRFYKQELTNYKPKEDLSLNGMELVKQNCYSCHNPNAASHDLTIAPPLVGVKMRYLKAYPEEEVFKSKMTSFLQEPTKEKSIMKGPVKRFGVMPKFQWSDVHIEAMVDYIYKGELEKPEWFEEHHKEMHPEE